MTPLAATTIRFRPAATNAFDRLNNPTTCSCCGRENLKKTVKMTDGVAIAWMGTGCAAKAMGVGIKVYTAQAKQVQDAADDAERRARDVERLAQDAKWQAYLDARAPQLRGERFRQIEALGGYAKANAAFVANTA